MESQVGKILWNATKAGALFFAVGAALSFALPYFATIAGVTGSLGAATNPVYLGLMFGGFGALDAAFRPAADYLFGKHESSANQQMPIASEPAKQQTIIVNMQPAVELEDKRHANHAKLIVAERQQESDGIILHR